jgi:hypothetical protein
MGRFSLAPAALAALAAIGVICVAIALTSPSFAPKTVSLLAKAKQVHAPAKKAALSIKHQVILHLKEMNRMLQECYF